jgi:hypothetical protein
MTGKLIFTLSVLLPFGINTASQANAETQIRFAPGNQCWTYSGVDTQFYGSFKAKQFITVSVVLQEAVESGMRTVAYSNNIWVNGPNDFHLTGTGSEQSNDTGFTTDRSGIYRFSIFEPPGPPHWDQPVIFQICAMPPEAQENTKTKADLDESAQHAGAITYTYICKDHHKSYPVTLTDPGTQAEDQDCGSASCTITFRGKTYPNVKAVDECRYGFRTTNNGITVDLCTATQGVATLTVGNKSFDCQMPRSERR